MVTDALLNNQNDEIKTQDNSGYPMQRFSVAPMLDWNEINKSYL